jgi:hypothetical protein
MCEVYMYIYNGRWRQMVLYITRDSYDTSIQAYIAHYIGVCIIPVHMYIYMFVCAYICAYNCNDIEHIVYYIGIIVMLL